MTIEIEKWGMTVPELTVNVICQARMGSTRLPGKVMRKMNGKPMIGWLIDTLEKVHCNEVLYVVPWEDYQTPLGSYLWKRGCTVVWGPKKPRKDINDVATMFKMAVEKYPCDAFVRICADSPLVHISDIEYVIHRLKQGAGYIHRGGLPGKNVQGVNVKLFIEYLQKFSDDEREHVLSFFDKRFSVVVDTEDDFCRVARAMELICFEPGNVEKFNLELLNWPRLQ